MNANRNGLGCMQCLGNVIMVAICMAGLYFVITECVTKFTAFQVNYAALNNILMGR